MTTTAAKQAILSWGEGLLGAGKVLWLNQNAPRPDKPYCTLHEFMDREIGIAEHIHETDLLALTVNDTVQEFRRLTVQVEVYTGPALELATLEALELLESLLLRLNSQPIIDNFRAARISFLSHEAPLRLDEFDGDRWERRALCDVHFLHLATSVPESIGQIDTADPSLTIIE